MTPGSPSRRRTIATSMYAPALSEAMTVPPTASAWPPASRVAFRFAFVYAAIYLLPHWLYFFPGIAFVGGWYSAADQWIDVRVAHVLLGPDTPIDFHTLGTGSGDTLLSYLSLAWQASFAAIAALLWTIVDRGHERYDTLHQW